MAPMFPLVVIVHADPEVRVKRLIEYRGFSEADARARIAAQATDEQRRAGRRRLAGQLRHVAGELVEQARELWYQRILPFAHNLHHPHPGAPARPIWCRPTRRWPDQARRIAGPAQHHLRAPGRAHRPHRVDGGARHGRQGRHRHPGDGRLPRGRRRTRRATCCGPAIRASSRSPPTCPSPMPAARSRFDHATMSVVAQAFSCLRRSGPADQRAYQGGRLAQPAVRVAVRRLVDGQPRRCRPTTWRSSGRRPRHRRHRRATPRPRSRGSSTPTGGRGRGPTRPAGGPECVRLSAAGGGVGGGGWVGCGHVQGAPHCSVP